jgi:hypothetical protein
LGCFPIFKKSSIPLKPVITQTLFRPSAWFLNIGQFGPNFPPGAIDNFWQPLYKIHHMPIKTHVTYADIDPDNARRLSQELGCHPVTAGLIWHRGFTTVESARFYPASPIRLP